MSGLKVPCYINGKKTLTYVKLNTNLKFVCLIKKVFVFSRSVVLFFPLLFLAVSVIS